MDPNKYTIIIKILKIKVIVGLYLFIYFSGNDEKPNREENNKLDNKRAKFTPDRYKRHHCDQCEYSVSSANSMKTHKERKHSTNEKWKFDYEQALKEAGVPLKFSCDMCEYWAIRPSFLEMHKERDHKPRKQSKHYQKVYRCEKCKYTSLNTKGLKAHYKLIHSS